MQKIYFATTNENKLREAKEILDVEVEAVKLNIDEIQTLDPTEAAKKKAYFAYQAFKKPVLVEDTSLFFKAWNGMPGVFIDCFIESVGTVGLLKMLGNEKNRKATAMTILGIFDGKSYNVYEGQINGKIALKIRGQNGFGWDPIFIPEQYTKTFAEMSSLEKNQISMRKKAFMKFKKEINRVLR